MKNGDQFWLHTCTTMQEIYAKHRSIFPNKLLKLRWPDGKDSSYINWDELMDVEFTHHFDDQTRFEFEMDINYAPIGWGTLPALFNIFKGQYIDPSRGRKYDAIKDDCMTSNEKDIGNSVPFLVWLDDWDEDESLWIHSCGCNQWDEIMNITDDKSPIWDIILDRSCDTDLFIGIFDGSKAKILPDVEYSSNPCNQGMTIDNWKKKISKLIREGYKPMVVQCVEWDIDDIEVVYWLEAPEKKSKEKKK